MTTQKKLIRFLPQKTINHLWETEKMEWRSSPIFKFGFTIFADDGKTHYEPGLQSFLGLISAIAVVLIYMFYMTANWLGFGLAIFITTIATTLPDIFKYIRKKNTEYAFNKNGVFFKLWGLGGTNIHFIDFADIDQITYVEYKEKRGVIYFMSNKDFYFRTYDFATGKERFHPTFEMIEDVIEMRNRLEVYRREKIAAKPTIYQN
ncbi:MAG: hypothetical protein R3E32_16720 [Chitinophagales bacterium]